MIMTCCPGFRNLLDEAGKRGLAVLARKRSDGIVFLLQSRGVAFDDEPKLRPVPLELSINIASDIGLRYCPACGRKLQELVDKWPDYFEKLAKEHEKFLEGWPQT